MSRQLSACCYLCNRTPCMLLRRWFTQLFAHLPDEKVCKQSILLRVCLCCCRDCILQHAPVTATNTTSAAAAAATAGARGFNQPQQQQPQWSHCVDLGCGTGLMGPLLRPHTRHLSGVDLSQGMVQKARERGCYDDLSVDELGKYLSDAAAAVAQQGRCWVKTR